MGRILVLFLLIEALVVAAMANNVESLASSPAEAPENKIRKMGNHRKELTRSSSSVSPSSSPSEPPLAKDDQENSISQVQEIKISKKQGHHHSIDKSVAGGGIILGGLATAFLAAIFCYIRATRRKRAEPSSPTSISSPRV